jgi:hypothetical protein
VRDNVYENIDDSDLRVNVPGPDNVFPDATVPLTTVVANSGLEPEYQDIRP